MSTKQFPIEKIFGSRTRVKVISLFTTGINRPYYVREISRVVDERLNAVRRELGILQKIGMLSSYQSKRRKYYKLKPNFLLLKELASIMSKTGPRVEDNLFKSINKIGLVYFVCASGLFTGADSSPTDLFIIGDIDEPRLKGFTHRVEKQIGKEITYTPMTLNEYTYRRNFNDMFLRRIFSGPYKIIINKLDSTLQPKASVEPAATLVHKSAR